MRKQIAAANWKMNLDLDQAQELAGKLTSGKVELLANQQAVFAVPFPYLVPVANKLAGAGGYFIAAQNCSDRNNGAYTGEVSAQMLKSLNVPFVIIGHSERREYYQETDAILAEKLNRAFENNIQPIFCCGEPLAERESGNHMQYVQNQLEAGLFHLDAKQVDHFIIAYEPIWAIGTGKTASSEQAQEMHMHIRSVMASKYGEEIATTISILYGGSVKASNAKEIFSQPDVDGGLVGGASLDAAEFSTIMSSLKSA